MSQFKFGKRSRICAPICAVVHMNPNLPSAVKNRCFRQSPNRQANISFVRIMRLNEQRIIRRVPSKVCDDVSDIRFESFSVSRCDWYEQARQQARIPRNLNRMRVDKSFGHTTTGSIGAWCRNHPEFLLIESESGTTHPACTRCMPTSRCKAHASCRPSPA